MSFVEWRRAGKVVDSQSVTVKREKLEGAAVPLLSFKMDEYPSLDDEFEALHAEEMEMMREMEGNGGGGVEGASQGVLLR